MFTPRHRPVSTNIAWMRYAAREQILEIQFKSGGQYRYFEFPGDMYDAFLAAESAGKFFLAFIKGHFECAKVEPDPEDSSETTPDYVAAASEHAPVDAPIGRCLACGRPLTDPVSQRRGIGPDCAAQGVDFSQRSMVVGVQQERLLRVSGLPEPAWRIRLRYGDPAAHGHDIPFADLLVYRWEAGRRVAIIACGAHRHRGATARSAFAELVRASQAFQALIEEAGPTRFFLLESGRELFRLCRVMDPGAGIDQTDVAFEPWPLAGLATRLSPKDEVAA